MQGNTLFLQKKIPAVLLDAIFHFLSRVCSSQVIPLVCQFWYSRWKERKPPAFNRACWLKPIFFTPPGALHGFRLVSPQHLRSIHITGKDITETSWHSTRPSVDKIVFSNRLSDQVRSSRSWTVLDRERDREIECWRRFPLQKVSSFPYDSENFTFGGLFQNVVYIFMNLKYTSSNDEEDRATEVRYCHLEQSNLWYSFVVKKEIGWYQHVWKEHKFYFGEISDCQSLYCVLPTQFEPKERKIFERMGTEIIRFAVSDDEETLYILALDGLFTSRAREHVLVYSIASQTVLRIVLKDGGHFDCLSYKNNYFCVLNRTQAKCYKLKQTKEIEKHSRKKRRIPTSE